MHSVSRTVREDIVPQVLSCSRSRNNQTELRKRRIQKDKNTENKILNSNKSVVEKAETWKTLEEFILYSFIYFISGTVNFILMILLINQWYLESQKPLVTLLMSKKSKRDVFNKENIANIMLGKKSKIDAWCESLSNSKVPESDWNGDFRVSTKNFNELCTILHPYLQKK